MKTGFTGFGGWRRLASGSLEAVALAARTWVSQGPEVPLTVFHNATGRVVDLDLRGSEEEVRARLASHPMAEKSEDESAEEAAPVRSGPGRPRLGVVSKEVSLLPRHWEWLQRQSSSASATLRKLIETEMKAGQAVAHRRQVEEAAYRVMSALGGDLPDFEEASRDLFAHRHQQALERMACWPGDVRDYLRELLEGAAS